MKLISLNIWGGNQFGPLMSFVAAHAPTTDVFCFQEVFTSKANVEESRGVRPHIYEELAAALPGFRGFFAPELDGFDFAGPVDFDLRLGQATFVRQRLPVTSSEEFFVFGKRNEPRDINNSPANVLCVRIAGSGGTTTACNFHGTAIPGHKLDTPERLAQSHLIADFLLRERGTKILCGDFNLLPGTESLRILEERMRNLVSEYRIPRTRSRLSPFFGKPDFQKFADYALVSPDLRVARFEAPDVAISDHLPLILEFSQR